MEKINYFFMIVSLVVQSVVTSSISDLKKKIFKSQLNRTIYMRLNVKNNLLLLIKLS